MKLPLHLLVLFSILILFSCKEASKKKTEVTEPQIEVTKQVYKTKDSLINKKRTATLKHYEYYFVSAKSGIKYRDKPKGKIIGEFPLNTQLKVLDNTGLTDSSKIDRKNIEGKWFGVEKIKIRFMYSTLFYPIHLLILI